MKQNKRRQRCFGHSCASGQTRQPHGDTDVQVLDVGLAAPAGPWRFGAFWVKQRDAEGFSRSLEVLNVLQQAESRWRNSLLSAGKENDPPKTREWSPCKCFKKKHFIPPGILQDNPAHMLLR